MLSSALKCSEVLSCAERPTLHPSERRVCTEGHRKPDYEGHDCLVPLLGKNSEHIENRRSYAEGEVSCLQRILVRFTLLLLTFGPNQIIEATQHFTVKALI